jgi:hypothetical protein
MARAKEILGTTAPSSLELHAGTQAVEPAGKSVAGTV